jgi:hypothetical protein
MELIRTEALDVAAGVFPAVEVVAVVLESNRCVSKDFVSGLADAFAKRKIFAEVPVAASVVFDHGLKPRCHSFPEHGVTDWQIEFALHVQIDLPSHKEETGSSVHDLQHAAVASELNPASLRKEFAGKLSLAFLDVEPRDHGQLMTLLSFNIIRVEANVRIDPHRLCETVLNGGAGNAISGHIDLREPSHSANRVASGFEHSQRLLTRCRNRFAAGNKDDAVFGRQLIHAAKAPTAEFSTPAIGEFVSHVILVSLVITIDSRERKMMVGSKNDL